MVVKKIPSIGGPTLKKIVANLKETSLPYISFKDCAWWLAKACRIDFFNCKIVHIFEIFKLLIVQTIKIVKLLKIDKDKFRVFHKL